MLHLCIGQTNVTFLATGQTKVVASQGWANVMVRQTSCLCIGQTNITILALGRTNVGRTKVLASYFIQ
jgi:hypothetical protein